MEGDTPAPNSSEPSANQDGQDGQSEAVAETTLLTAHHQLTMQRRSRVLLARHLPLDELIESLVLRATWNYGLL